MIRKLHLILVGFCITGTMYAQNDLLSELISESSEPCMGLNLNPAWGSIWTPHEAQWVPGLIVGPRWIPTWAQDGSNLGRMDPW